MTEYIIVIVLAIYSWWVYNMLEDTPVGYTCLESETERTLFIMEDRTDNIINCRTDDSAESDNICEACARTRKRTEKEYKDLLNRLSRIEGQIRGIRGMLEKDAYCIDIINQVSAANCALNSFTKVLLASHIRNCVAEDVQSGNEEKLDELVATLQKLMK